MFQGNPYNLTHVSQYLAALKDTKKEDSNSNKNTIYCELMFYLIKSKGGVDSIGKDNIEKETQ